MVLLSTTSNRCCAAASFARGRVSYVSRSKLKRRVVEWGEKATEGVNREIDHDNEIRSRALSREHSKSLDRKAGTWKKRMWSETNRHTTQLLPAAEGTMPSGQWRQKGEAADVKATHVTTNSLRLAWCSAAHTASKQLREGVWGGSGRRWPSVRQKGQI